MATSFSCDGYECPMDPEYEITRTIFVREINKPEADADAKTEIFHACSSHLAQLTTGELAKRFTPEGRAERSKKTKKKR